MKTSELLLSSLNITEDDYSYKGLFILSCGGKSLQMDMADLEKETKMAGLRAYFELDECTDEICRILMDMIFDKAHISSVIIEGEDYEENAKRKKSERLASSFDIA